MKSFRVSKLNEHEYLISAPSYWGGKLMGYSERIFDSRDNTLNSTTNE